MNRAFLITVVVVAVALAGTPAGAQPVSIAASQEAVAGGLSVLYSQLDNPGGGYSAQDFEAAYDIYDAYGADDFTVPANTTWTIQGIGINGVTLVGDQPDSFDVNFHLDDAGTPLDPPRGGLADLSYALVQGTYRIILPGNGVSIPGGSTGRTVWLSVQANMDFLDLGDQWFWTSRTVQAGAAGAWKNPGDGFGTGCTAWGTLTGCLGAVEPDWQFILVGSSSP